MAAPGGNQLLAAVVVVAALEVVVACAWWLATRWSSVLPLLQDQFFWEVCLQLNHVCGIKFAWVGPCTACMCLEVVHTQVVLTGRPLPRGLLQV